MRQTKPLVVRALPALLLILAVAACSRGPEPAEKATVDSGSPEVVVIATDQPNSVLLPPEQVTFAQAELIEDPLADEVVEYARDSRHGGVVEDHSDHANKDLSANPNGDWSSNESPHPNRYRTGMSVGLGGGVGGGGGRGGVGGFAHRRARGGTGQSAAVKHGPASLDWLADHQNREGFWSSAQFADDTTRSGAKRTSDSDAGWENQDMLITGLSLLAFAGAGYDHKQGAHRQSVRSAILYFRKVQKNDGRFCPCEEDDTALMEHAVVTAALAEQYGLSGDQVLKPNVDKAVEYLLKRQLPDSGWGDKDANLRDTAWALLALKSAKLAGIEFAHGSATKSAAKFLGQMHGVDAAGKRFVTYSTLADTMPLYRSAGERAELPRAEALWVMGAILSGRAATLKTEISELMQVVTAEDNLPEWKTASLDFMHWHWSSLGAHHVGGKTWQRWEKALSDTLIPTQRGFSTKEKAETRNTLDEHGSWDPTDAWGAAFGRVYSTAINSLTLQTSNRYLKAENADSDDDALPDFADFMNGQTVSRRANCGGLTASRNGRSMGTFPLRHTDVHAKVSGTVAGTTVTQTFTNPFKEVIEARYTFPLPNDSAINEFVMTVGSRRIVGVVRPKGEAIKIYREARARGQTATLLVQNRPNVFTQNLANIEVGGEVKVSITYYQTLNYEDGRFAYMFPMTLGERYGSTSNGKFVEDANPSPPDIDDDGLDDTDEFDVRSLPPGMRSGMDVDITVEVNTGIAIDMSRTRSLAHEVLATVNSPESITFELNKIDAIPNRDFVLHWGLLGERPEVGLLNHRVGKGGYLQLQLQPQLDPHDADVTPREITFILDTSGSMSGKPSQMTKQIIRKTLDHLHPDDTFNIVYFAGSNGQVFERPAANTPANVEKAREFLLKAKAGGGTEMLKGLQRALKAEHDSRYLQMYAFLTDGHIGGERSIHETVAEHSDAARFFAFGIGSAPNQHLIDGIAEHGKGKAIYCVPRDGVYDESAVEAFYGAIDRPVLCDISIDWNGLSVQESYPSTINDLFASQPLTVTARYKGTGKHTINVNGRVGANWVTYPVEIDLDAESANPAIATIWARKRIADLERKLINQPRDAYLEDQIMQTALEFNLMSRFTSFVAVDESRVVGDGRPMEVWQPNEMPENVTYAGDDAAEGSKSFRIAAWGLWVGQTADGRVIVVKVEDGGAAANAGMQPGQVIESLNGVEVGNLDKLEKVLLQTEAKIELETSITDNGQVHEARFKLPELGK